MQPWLVVSLLVCVFGFLKEIRPSEPYVYDFLIGPWRNISDQVVEDEVYPVGTYSQMLLQVLVFLITDFARYKSIIIVLGLSGVAVFSMLLWTSSLLALQAVEVFYGMMAAAEVAYFTYIYAKVDKAHYQKVTSYTRAAILVGRSLSGVLSEVLVKTDAMDYRQLNYISLAGISAATIWAIFLPPVNHSIYFHSETNIHLPLSKKIGKAFSTMYHQFLASYSNLEVLKWSLWWAFSTCGYIQVEDYMQSLYRAIQGEDSVADNGAVETILALLGFMGAMLAGYVHIDGELILAVLSAVQGGLLLVASQTTHIYFCYTLYVAVGVLYYFVVTVAAHQIAKRISEDSYGLIFGFNSFVALVFQSLLTTLVATKGVALQLRARDQYLVYGGYHLCFGAVFVVIGIRSYLVKRREDHRREDNEIVEKAEVVP